MPLKLAAQLEQRTAQCRDQSAVDALVSELDAVESVRTAGAHRVPHKLAPPPRHVSQKELRHSDVGDGVPHSTYPAFVSRPGRFCLLDCQISFHGAGQLTKLR